MDMKLLSCHSTTTVIPMKSIRFQNGLLCQVFLYLSRTVLCSASSGNGVKFVFGRDALQLGSARILENRVGHWSSSMKSFSAKSSRTLNPLSRDCGRHDGCVLAILLFKLRWELLAFKCSSLLLCMIYILHIMIYIL